MAILRMLFQPTETSDMQVLRVFHPTVALMEKVFKQAAAPKPKVQHTVTQSEHVLMLLCICFLCSSQAPCWIHLATYIQLGESTDIRLIMP